MQFETFLNQYREQAFEWGKCDCCLFAADWIKVNTAEDLAADLRGKYSTELGANRALKKLGFDGVTAIADARIGEGLSPLQLNRGDIALVKNHVEQDTLGIVYGNQIWVLGLNGIETLPVTTAIKGWRVEICQQ